MNDKATKRAPAPTCSLSNNALTITPRAEDKELALIIVENGGERKDIVAIAPNIDLNETPSVLGGHIQFNNVSSRFDGTWEEGHPKRFGNGYFFQIYSLSPVADPTAPKVQSDPWETKVWVHDGKFVTEDPSPVIKLPPPPTPMPKAEEPKKEEKAPPGYATIVKRLERIKNDLVKIEAKQLTPDTFMLKSMGLALDEIRGQVISLKSMYSKFQGWNELTKIVDELERHYSVACANFATEMAKTRPVTPPTPVVEAPTVATPPTVPPTPVVEETKVVSPPPTPAEKPAEEVTSPSKPVVEEIPAGSFDDRSALAQQELKVAKDEISALQSQIDFIRELAVGTATKVAQTQPTSPPPTPPSPPPVMPPAPATPPAKKGSWYERSRPWFIPLLILLMAIGLGLIVWQVGLFKKSATTTTPTPAVTDTIPFMSAVEDLRKSVDEIGRRLVIVPPVVTNMTDFTNAMQCLLCGGIVGNANTFIIGKDNVVIHGSNNTVNGCCPTTAKPTTPPTAQLPPEKPVEVKAPNWWELPPTKVIDGRSCVPSNNCCKTFTISTMIKAGELLQVIIPDGWNMSCYTPANSDQIECVIDGKPSTKHSGQVKVAADPLQQHEWRLRLVGIQETSLEFTFYRIR